MGEASGLRKFRACITSELWEILFLISSRNYLRLLISRSEVGRLKDSQVHVTFQTSDFLIAFKAHIPHSLWKKYE